MMSGIETGVEWERQRASALDHPIVITTFRDAGASTKRQGETTLRGLIPMLRETRAPSKADLPWLKLAAFGDARTDKGSLRHNSNIIHIYGIEADYDGEQMTLSRARQIIGSAGLAAILYTSPSHTADRPRWRVLCPTSKPLLGSERAGLLSRLNGLFLGALADESFVLSQSYYYGAIHGAPDHTVIAIDGGFIDHAHQLNAGALGRSVPKKPQAAAAGTAPRLDGDASPYGRRALENECHAIRTAGPGQKHHTLNRAAYSVGGLVSGGHIQEGFAFRELSAALNSIAGACDDFDHAQRTLQQAFEDGMASPRTVQERPRSKIRDDGWRESPPYEEFNDDVAEPVFEPEEAVHTTRSHNNGPLWTDEDEWLEAEIPKRPWCVPGYLMRGSVSVLSGQGAGGKSSLVVAWSIAAALGKALGEFKPLSRLTVCNYNVEDDQQEQRRRYSAGLHAAQHVPADIAGQVIRCGPSTIGTLFQRDPASGTIDPTKAMEALERLCMERQVDVLICDPLAELHNAEENDNTAMRAVIAAFRGLASRLGIAVMILHHDRKGTNAPGDMDRMRGASAITGAVRVMLTLTPMSEEEADKFGVEAEHRRRHFRIDGAKSNYAIAQDAEWWKLAGYDLANGEQVAACRPWSPPGTFSGLNMADCVAILDAIDAGTPTGFAWASHVNAKDDWAGRLIEAKGKSEGQAKAILASWVEGGALLIVENEGPRRGHPRKSYVVVKEAVAAMRRQSHA
jgi:hypothetical protein